MIGVYFRGEAREARCGFMEEANLEGGRVLLCYINEGGKQWALMAY